MVEGTHRNTYAEVDLEVIKQNINAEKKLMDTQQSLFAVVKANAYGHGLVEVSQAAHAAGVDGFCVAIIDEGLKLRSIGLSEMILVLGVNPAAQAVVMAQNNLSATVDSLEFLEDAAVFLRAHKLQLAVHLALDTGMSRIGFRTPAALAAAVTFLKAHQTEFKFEGIFTHFATADSSKADAQAYYRQQLTRFQQLMAVVAEKPRYVHVANSAASLWHREAKEDAVRFGVAMYGLNPSGGDLELPPVFKPALSLSSEIISLRRLAAGESVGYGKTYTAKNDEWIATVPIGYADGWLRRMQGFAVLVAGKSCEIVGRVCMDQIMIRLPQKIAVGTRVTLIGENQGKTITAQDVATYSETIHYEVLCALSERVPRYYN
ncbi:MAG: alanine racemase [Liquorilactobacillus satsumensis]|uniref:alanine racemase n=1 Tax=Liquorilactobacillus satsumensis TaxID=259059 RepID=UPI0039E9C0F3